MSFHKILAATDLSDASDEALRRGVRLANALGASLMTAHVVPDRVGSQPMFPQDASGAASGLPGLHKRAMRELVERTIAAGAEEGSFEVAVLDGDPADTILAHAKQWGADLVVVTPTGKGAVAQALIGSVATKVLTESSSSVLLARTSALTKKLLVAADFSEPSDAAFEVAVDIAGKSGFFLTAVHVLDAPNFPEMGSVPLKVKAAAFQEVESALADMLSESGTDGDLIVEEGEPVGGLLAAIAKATPELLVTGTSGQAGVVFGSIARAVAGKAPVSVLVVRA